MAVVESAAAIGSGLVTSEEVVRAHVERMHAVNPALNAVVVDLSEQAISAARAADQAKASGVTLGKLYGVPVTIKINIDVEGQANSNGVVAFKDNIAPGDSPVTANLKKSGAIIIGLTNTPEFSMRGFTDNPLHGATMNPWGTVRLRAAARREAQGLRSRLESAPSRMETTSGAPCDGRLSVTAS